MMKKVFHSLMFVRLKKSFYKNELTIEIFVSISINFVKNFFECLLSNDLTGLTEIENNHHFF